MLETAGVVENDSQIVGWPLPRTSGLALRKDADRPRVVLEIEVLPVAQAELPIARPRAAPVPALEIT